MKIFGVVNQKGGVGKSPMTWEVASALAARGRRVLMVDFDPQGTLTAGVLGPDGRDIGTAEIILDQVKLRNAIQPTKVEGLSILSAHQAKLAAAEQNLSSRGVDGFTAFVEALEGEDNVADIIVCDCPPNLSILTGNVLTASDWVLVPVSSSQARVALSQLKRTVLASRRLNPSLEVFGAILTMYNEQRRLSADRLAAIQADDFFPRCWPVRTSDGFEKAFRAGRPLRAIASSPAERAAVAEVDRIAEAITQAIDVPRVA